MITLDEILSIVHLYHCFLSNFKFQPSDLKIACYDMVRLVFFNDRQMHCFHLNVILLSSQTPIFD